MRPGPTVRIVAASLAVLLLAWWVLGRRDDVEAEWVRVERDDLVIAVEVEGTLRSEDTTSLGPPQVPGVWDYKISMLGEEGRLVEAGDPVVGFDTSELQRRLREMEAESEEAAKEIDKELAQQSLDRQRDELALAEAQGRRRKAALKVDVPGELAAATELKAARLDLELAEREIAFLERKLAANRRSGEARLDALRSQKRRADERVQEIRDAIEAMTVRAPRPGTVVHITNWRDEKKKVGDSCWRGEKVLEIPDLERMVGDGEVDEAYASLVEVGQPLTLRLDAHPDDEFTGRVASIWDTVQPKSWRNPAKVARLEITLDRTDTRRMRPGMRFRADIEIERIPQTLVLPLDSVFLADDGPVVYRKTWGGYERVTVTLGRRSARQVEVVAGLDEGDRIARVDLDRRQGSAG